MNTAQSDTRTANGKKPARKVGTSKKPAKKTSSPTKATKASQIAEKYNVNPKRLRTRLRAESIGAPYDAKAILEIERICKEMAKS